MGVRAREIKFVPGNIPLGPTMKDEDSHNGPAGYSGIESRKTGSLI